MKKIISKCQYGLHGVLNITPDKSISHRAIMLASMINGKTLIKGVSKACDPLSTIRVCKNLGVKFDFLNENDVIVESTGVFQKSSNYLNCGNSGTTMRLMTGILAPLKLNYILIGDESLSNRPMRRIIEPLTRMGAVIYSTNNLSPLYVIGQKMHGIDYNSKLASAQVKSCVLLAGLNSEGKTTFTEPALSRNHTEIMMKYLNADIKSDGLSVTVKPSKMEPKTIEIPGDISSAAFFIAAALLIPNSDIVIKNVGLNPARTGIIDIARKMGGDIEILDEKIICGEIVGDIRVKYSELKGVCIEGKIIPKLIDELPVIAVMAAQAEGETLVKNAEDLRNKESDRITAIVNMLGKLGADIVENNDGFVIRGKASFQGETEIESFGDHRLAMSAYVAGLLCKKDISILNFESIDISFPEFEECFSKISM